VTLVPSLLRPTWTLPRLVERPKLEKAHKFEDMPAEYRGLSTRDWAAVASPPHGLSIAVAFPTGG
jgi:hypothetical protein